MDFTKACIITAVLVYITGTAVGDTCYSIGPKFTEITSDGTVDKPLTDFCHDHRGVFKQNHRAAGCVSTTKGDVLTSLNITVEFFSILNESNVNFTEDACKYVLNEGSTGSTPPDTTMDASTLTVFHSGQTMNRCERGGEEMFINYGPVEASHRMSIRRQPLVQEDNDSPSKDPAVVTNAGSTQVVSTTTLPAQPDTDSAGKSTCNEEKTMVITEIIYLIQTVQPTSHISSPSMASSKVKQSTSTFSNLNTFFVGKLKLDPNSCGCAGCPTATKTVSVTTSAPEAATASSTTSSSSSSCNKEWEQGAICAD